MTRKDPNLSPSSVSLRPVRGALLAIAASALLLAACSAGNTTSSSGAATTDCTKAVDGVVKMSAENIAFDTGCIEVPAGEAFTIEFTNKDTAPHDVAIYNDSGKSTAIFTGDPVSEQNKTVSYAVPALDAGEHYFECTIHPNMNGKVVAK
jgi:plastocyanin